MKLGLPLTIVIPFSDRSRWNPLRDVDIERMIEQLGNPAREDIKTRLDETGKFHFMSIHAIASDADCDRSFIVIEASVDCRPSEAITHLDNALGDDLAPILVRACGLERRSQLRRMLARHNRTIRHDFIPFPGRVSGLPFNGVPGVGVRDVLLNAKIVEKAREFLDSHKSQKPNDGPLTTFGAVRSKLLEASEQFHARLKSPNDRLPFAERADAPWLTQRQVSGMALRFIGASWQWIVLFFGSAYATALAVALLLPHAAETGVWERLPSAMMLALGPGLMLAILSLYWLLTRVWAAERANVPNDTDPDPALLSRIMSRENLPGQSQNHMISIAQLEPGVIRRVMLLFAFYVVDLAARLKFFRSGFLASIGTIHFARWIKLPGTKRLLFMSNYDGSWESYLEDFIFKATPGLTSIWGNCRGFPKTENLFFKGAQDGDRFKRFARRTMKPTPFWYSAYPQLTCQHVRRHALIVSGLNDKNGIGEDVSAAEAWVQLFGSLPRPDYGLEYEEIQTLMFGGLSNHRYSYCIPVSFVTGTNQEQPYRDVQTWLAGLPITFGDAPPPDRVANIAFSASGLRKLGLDRELDCDDQSAPGTRHFPAAFALGMAHKSRKQLLKDPDLLDWCDDVADAVLLIYSTTELVGEVLRADYLAPKVVKEIAIITTHLKQFDAKGYAASWRQGAGRGGAVLPVSGGKDLTEEPFGFVDGVSQPKVRGFPGKLGTPDPIHSVEPGEFLLGYKDNRGFFPPTPLIDRKIPHMFPEIVLPATVPDMPQQWPDFSRPGAPQPPLRDFGRNGSFLVIRQLWQDVDGFNRSLDQLAARVQKKVNPYPGNDFRMREWVAAKLFGRWRNGSSLVEHPYEPFHHPDADEAADNGFLFKDVDPQGKRCPLGAHIRRAFPRDSFDPASGHELAVTNRHRLLRRGRTFLDKKGDPAGLLFMCFNADIERQFEFVQQSWIGDSAFHGLSGEHDPVAMHRQIYATIPNNSPPPCSRMTLPTAGPPLTLEVPSFVELRAGGYFFMPGRHTFWFLGGEPWMKKNSKSVSPS